MFASLPKVAAQVVKQSNNDPKFDCLYHRHLRKIDWLMAHTAYIVCLVSTVSGSHKNALGKDIASSRHIPKLERSRIFFRYLWFKSSCHTHHKRIADFYKAICFLINKIDHVQSFLCQGAFASAVNINWLHYTH